MLLLITYPRSGAHFFRENFTAAQGGEDAGSFFSSGMRLSTPNPNMPVPGPISKFHHVHMPVFYTDRKKVTIVRNPRDSIASWAAMSWKKHGNGITMREFLKREINRYVVMYRFLLSEVDLIIKYENLLEDPKGACRFVAEQLELEFKDYTYVSKLQDEPEDAYYVSSKNLDDYQAAKAELETMNLWEANRLYSLAASRANF
jgi:hypothetical protein